MAPIGRLDDDSHRPSSRRRGDASSKNVGGGTGLYDTIWAAYQKVQKSYDPDRVNAVVMLTDGRNEDPNGMSLDELKANLRKASDPTKPIAITTIGIGPDVDPKALTAISRMTYSDFYSAPEPGRHDDRARARSLRPRLQGRSLRLSGRPPSARCRKGHHPDAYRRAAT